MESIRCGKIGRRRAIIVPGTPAAFFRRVDAAWRPMRWRRGAVACVRARPALTKRLLIGSSEGQQIWEGWFRGMHTTLQVLGSGSRVQG
jgi:hypothetical protein